MGIASLQSIHSGVRVPLATLPERGRALSAVRKAIRQNHSQVKALIDAVFSKAINGDIESMKLIFDKLDKI